LHLDGDILTMAYRDYLSSYRLDKLTDTSAAFRKVGRYDPTPVEHLFGYASGTTAALGGLFFTGNGGSNSLGVNSKITVFDVTGPRPRPVGHFAFPDADGYLP